MVSHPEGGASGITLLAGLESRKRLPHVQKDARRAFLCWVARFVFCALKAQEAMDCRERFRI